MHKTSLNVSQNREFQQTLNAVPVARNTISKQYYYHTLYFAATSRCALTCVGIGSLFLIVKYMEKLRNSNFKEIATDTTIINAYISECKILLKINYSTASRCEAQTKLLQPTTLRHRTEVAVFIFFIIETSMLTVTIVSYI